MDAILSLSHLKKFAVFVSNFATLLLMPYDIIYTTHFSGQIFLPVAFLLNEPIFRHNDTSASS